MTLVLENLSMERNHQPLFNAINFAINSGECLMIRGTNGCGKTTLLRSLAGFIEPHSGSIYWQNKNIFQFDNYQQQLNYVGHQPAIKPNLTVQENLLLAATLKRNIPQTLDTTMQTLQIKHLKNKKASFLSAGQLRRVSLARLLLNPTKLWILDEPTTTLDAEGIDLFASILKQHLDHHGIAVVATHQTIPLHQSMPTLVLGVSHEH